MVQSPCTIRGVDRLSDALKVADIGGNAIQSYDAFQRQDYLGAGLGALGVGVRGVQTGFAINRRLGGTNYRWGNRPLRSISGRGVGRGEISATGSLWTNRPPGIQVRKIGNHWVKRVDPNANPIMRAWGRETIRAQEAALTKLHAAGSPAANFRRLRNGAMAIEDVGPTMSRGSYLDHNYWRAWYRDSRIIGIANDLKPGNYGAGYRAFDPALDRYTIGVAGIGGLSAAGGTLYLLDKNGIIDLIAGW